MITRTVAVSLFASYIHDEAKKPIRVLRAVPRICWCKEAYRFAEEVVNETVALSGMKFFFITRNMILTVSFMIQKSTLVKEDNFFFPAFKVAGTVATYELVMLQINTDT